MDPLSGGKVPAMDKGRDIRVILGIYDMDKENFLHAGDFSNTFDRPLGLRRDTGGNKYPPEHPLFSPRGSLPAGVLLLTCQARFELVCTYGTKGLFLPVKLVESIRFEHDALVNSAVREAKKVPYLMRSLLR